MSGLILASASKSRASVLSGAGVAFAQHPSNVDEAAVKAAMRGAAAAECADKLAELKALDVSTKHLAAYVLGCDQMLSCEDRWFDKPTDLAVARTQLCALRGRTHALFNGMAVAHGGAVVWRYADRAELTMRDFSDVFLDEYLAQSGERVLWSVGGYQLEGPGAQLFSAVRGDFFSILGLPLLPLLAFLREHGLLQS